MSLFEDIGKFEGFKDEVYVDHKGIATIGVGYNLRNTDVLSSVLKAFGYSVETLGEVEFSSLVEGLSDIFEGTYTTATLPTAIATVETRLTESRSNMGDVDEAAAQTEFKFIDNSAVDTDGYGSTLDEMKPIFDAALEDFEAQIIAQLKTKIRGC